MISSKKTTRSLLYITLGILAGALLLVLFFHPDNSMPAQQKNSTPPPPETVQKPSPTHSYKKPFETAPSVHKITPSEYAADGTAPAAPSHFHQTMMELMTHPPGFKRRDAMLALLQEWTQTDPVKAAMWALDQPTDPTGQNDRRIRALELVASTWAQTDPETALEWLSQLSNPDEKWQTERCALAAWAESDPLSMSLWIGKAPGRTDRDQIAAQLAESWADNDPQAAAEWALSQPSENQLLKTILLAWTQTDPRSAVEFLADLPVEDPDTLIMLQTAICDDLAKTDPLIAWETANQLPEPFRTSRLQTALEKMAEQSPETAYAYYCNLPDESTLKMDLVPNIAGMLGNYDEKRTEGILKWMDLVLEMTESPSGSTEYYQEQLSTALRIWTARDPESATEWALKQTEYCKDKDHSICVIAEEWSTRDATSASQLLASSPETEDSRKAWETVLYNLAAQSPALAATLASEHAPESPEITREIASNWTAQDPEQAAQWVTRLPASDSRTTALIATIQTWFSQDAQRTEQWISSLPAQEDRILAEKTVRDMKHATY